MTTNLARTLEHVVIIMMYRNGNFWIDEMNQLDAWAVVEGRAEEVLGVRRDEGGEG